MPRAALLSLGLLATACPATPEPSPPLRVSPAVDWASAIRVELRHDPDRGALVAKVEVKPGFHAYTTGETVGRPMKLALDPSSPVQLAGPVAYPAGHARDLAVGRSVIVEGEAEVVGPVRGTGEARGTFDYQVCRDDACDRPRSQRFSLGVGVSGR